MDWIYEWEMALKNWNIKYDAFPSLESVWAEKPDNVPDSFKNDAFNRWSKAMEARSNNYWGVTV
jgi:hypothetical protein